MQRYTATAINPQGDTVNLKLQAYSSDDAERKLCALGFSFVLIH